MNKKVFFTILTILILIAGGVLTFLFLDGKIMNRKSKVYKIGILNGFDYLSGNEDGFIDGMTDLGYVNGENVNYVIEETNVNIEEYQKALGRLVAADVDMLYSFPTEATLEAKKIAIETGIPLVFSHANFEDVNLFDSIQRPGNNMTGVRYPGPDVALKGFEILMEIMPNAKNIVLPYERTYPIVPSQMKIVREWAEEIGVNVIEAGVTSLEELQSDLDKLDRNNTNIDAVLLIADPVSGTPSYVSIFGKFAYERNIPICALLLLKEAGFEYESLYGIDVNTYDGGYKAAKFADKVLRGADPNTMPVESSEIYFTFNYKEAQRLGLKISEDILRKADKIYR